jgi:pilus assembly protein CpaB
MQVLPSLALGDRKRPLLIAAGTLAALALILALAGVHPRHGTAHTSIMAPVHPHPRAVPAPAPPAAAITKGIAAHLATGRRAFSLRVTQDEIVGGFLQSGDHVDIFATLPGSLYPAQDAQRLPDRSQALLLLQNVPVLAVGEKRTRDGAVQPDARTVSLSLAPEDLARLALAERFGKISLAIRAPGDKAVVPPARATLADLTPGPGGAMQSDAPAKTAHAHTHAIPFYAGAHRYWRRLP